MFMRYVAELQRFDEAHVTVAEGPFAGPVQEAAIAIYAALVPQIVASGYDYIHKTARPSHGDRAEADVAASYNRDGISGRLRALEWGIGVYDRNPDSGTGFAELIFWVGATREDPATNRQVGG